MPSALENAVSIASVQLLTEIDEPKTESATIGQAQR